MKSYRFVPYMGQCVSVRKSWLFTFFGFRCKLEMDDFMCPSFLANPIPVVDSANTQLVTGTVSALDCR